VRVLFLATHRPGRAPGQRFRYEQYLDYLGANGIECEHSWLLDEADDRRYARGSLRQRAEVILRTGLARGWKVASGQTRRFDAVFVFREAFYLGPPVLESLVRRLGSKIVFDFDDAIFKPAVSESNRRWAWLRSGDRVDRTMTMSSLVFAGNRYLAEHARKFAPRVEIVPTTIDTDEYVPQHHRPSDAPVCIGWSGSVSTMSYFRLSLPVLRRIKARFGDRVCFKVIGDGSFHDGELALRGNEWKLASEVADLREIDIGLMPLPDDEWTRGKCGLKGLQYMALEIPTLMSPVGVNEEIISDGVNGFLPKTDEQWFERISELVTSAELRRRLGAAGRRTVVERYSVRAWRDSYVRLLRSLEKPDRRAHHDGPTRALEVGSASDR
jgi:glycosyltransferase involved in cell wall biosynthesis